MNTKLYISSFTRNAPLYSKSRVKLISDIILLSFFTASPLFSQKVTTVQKCTNTKNIKSKKPNTELNPKIKKAASTTLKDNSNNIWFEKNDGQFGNPDVLYGFRTSFGSMGVYKNKLRIVTQQREKDKRVGKQIVDINFPGSQTGWSITPGDRSNVKGTYNTKNARINAEIYNELTLKNVYDGIDLRLYTGGDGSLEFDWQVAKARDYKKIRMHFTGQDRININKNGDAVIDLRHNDMKIRIPETYQMFNGNKKNFGARMRKLDDKNTIRYDVAGNIDPNHSLIIDPIMQWSTFMHNNTSTFDEYLYTIAANSVSEVYACGITNEDLSIVYMSNVSPGYSGVYNPGLTPSDDEQAVVLYRLNPTGTAITAWTYTGQQTNIPVALGIFPDDRVLVVYQTDTIQIFSSDLTTRIYNDAISSGVATNVLSYQSQAIIDNDVFYLGGIAQTPLPSSIIPVTAPDPLIAGNEGVILRIKNASTTPVAEWGTYVGGSSNESFTAIAATPDKSKIAFAVHVDGSGNTYPALVNAIDNTISGTELLIGVIPTGTPTAFSVFSYLGGTSDEGKSAKGSNAALVAADNNYFYVAGNTSSTDLPGTTGSAQPAHGASSTLADQFLSQVPLNGSAGSGFISTYNGGSKFDIVGGLVIDLRTHDVLLFGTAESTDFPVYNAIAYSPFYQPVHGNTTNGALDITYTVFANGLKSRKFSTYIGGSYNDYLGSTGKLQGTGHFHYNVNNGLTYIGTTIHSDQTTIPTQWMSDIPGFDKSIPTATTSKDSHFIFAMNPNTSDFGDAPASYDAGTPANSAVASFNIRVGAEIDAEEGPNSSVNADGDDVQNFGSGDDEDGPLSLPSISTGATDYVATVSVFNNTGAPVNLCGWIDTDGNGVFDSYEYATVTVPSSASQQIAILNFTGLPPFANGSGFTYLRLRIANVPLTAADATGTFGQGEVEDHIIVHGVILPVLLDQFSALANTDNVLVKWAVSKEINVHEYEVEYSTDKIHFTGLGITPNTGDHNYSKIHSTPVTGVNYYRLKITGSDGNVSYSAVQKVVFGRNTTAVIFSNPVKDIIKIGLSGAMVNKPANLCLFSSDGRMLNRRKINALNQTEMVDISRYPDGHYILKIITSSEIIQKEILILK